jgi:hypothetical protein
MYGPRPVPFEDGCAVASMDMSTEYELILLTSEEPKGRCKWEDGTKGQSRLPDGGGKPLNTLHQMVHRFTGAIGWPDLQLNAR